MIKKLSVLFVLIDSIILFGVFFINQEDFKFYILFQLFSIYFICNISIYFTVYKYRMLSFNRGVYATD